MEPVELDGGGDPRRREGVARPLGDRVNWVTSAPGVESATLSISTGGPTSRLDLVLARIAPGSVRRSLAWDRDPDSGGPNWDLERTPDDALLSLNASKFLGTVPWGRVRIDGAERLPFGLTVPAMARVMGALGARSATWRKPGTDAAVAGSRRRAQRLRAERRAHGGQNHDDPVGARDAARGRRETGA